MQSLTPSRSMEHAAQVFPMDLIRSVEDSACSLRWEALEEQIASRFSQPNRLTPNPLFIGIDVGRRHDLTVCWTLERVSGICYTREILILDGVPFPDQEKILATRLNRARYAAIDSTGLGGPVSEHLARRLGEYKLDAVNFTQERKRELFSRAKKAFQAKSVRIPAEPRLRDDLASIQRIVTPQGIVKFIAARTRDGHADRSTALALALHAAAKFPEGSGIDANTPARSGRNPRHHRPMQTRFRKAWRS